VFTSSTWDPKFDASRRALRPGWFEKRIPTSRNPANRKRGFYAICDCNKQEVGFIFA
jgi:hypothetical protein